MATFVLVHGAWHGGWCWRLVRPLLEQAGHHVTTPTLTGLGERTHLLSHDITLDTFIDDIANHILFEDLQDVILVGHSFGGHVITGVADRLRDRVRHLVYLDAFWPADGESPVSHATRLMNPAATEDDIAAAKQARLASASAQGGVPCGTPETHGVPSEPADIHDWVAQRLVLHPVGTMVQPIHLPNGGSDGLPRSYVLCTGGTAPTPFQALVRQRIKGAPDWTLSEIATGHDAMITAPEDTARLLLAAAKDHR